MVPDETVVISNLPTGKTQSLDYDEQLVIPKDNEERERLEKTYRDEIVHHIFGKVGAIENDFSCAYHGKILFHGRLFITDSYICFYSNLFGFEKKMKFRYSHIVNMKRENTALLIPNAISISTETNCYVFRSFWDREEAFAAIKIHLEPHQVQPEVSQINNRTNEPNMENKIETDTTVAINSNDVSQTKGIQEKVPQVLPNDASNPPSLPTSSSRLQSGIPGEFLDEMDIERVPTTNPNLNPEELLEEDGKPLKTLCVEGEIQMSLEELIKCAVEFDGPKNVTKFHKFKGDKEVEETAWEESEKVNKSRIFHFCTETKSPIGPPIARASKTQNWTSYSNIGFVINTSTQLEDIPYSDCFFVQDRLCARKINENTCKVVISMDVKFLKKTMMKSMIEKKTKVDTADFFKEYFDFLQRPKTLEETSNENDNNGGNETEGTASLGLKVIEELKNLMKDLDKISSGRHEQMIRLFGMVILMMIVILILLAIQAVSTKRAMDELSQYINQLNQNYMLNNNCLNPNG